MVEPRSADDWLDADPSNSGFRLIALARDPDYGPPVSVRRRVIGALAYFSKGEDLIPDTIPGLGFLDDAIMLELIGRELAPELRAFRDFCRFRESAQRGWRRLKRKPLESRLAEKRRQLRLRVSSELERRGKTPRRSLW